jgi:U6 snRNA-associated Sm-like protein LSm8
MFLLFVIIEMVSIVASDGRIFVGVLKSFDQSTNCVLSDCVERVFSDDARVEFVHLGLYMLRGDNMYVYFSTLQLHISFFFIRAVVGEIDEEIDKRLDFSFIKALPIQPVHLL